MRVGTLQPDLPLSAQMCLVGRDSMYQCWVAIRHGSTSAGSGDRLVLLSGSFEGALRICFC